MTRRRWRITLLGALATLAAVYPITSLFTEASWLPEAVLMACLVAGLGLVARGLTRSRVLVVAVQVLVLTYVILARWTGDSFAYLVPTLSTLEAANSLGLQALETIQRYSAPAPLNDGVTFCLVIAIAAVAIAVDAMAATWRSPAAAGLPLLTAYLITAANGQAALALRFFVVPVALWLVMLHTTARAQFGRWGTATANERSEIDEAAHDREALRSFSGGALRLGAVGVVAALLVPALTPHFPPRYLTEGLGRSVGGGGEGSVGFNDTLDLARSLNDQDQSPVLSYTTTGFTRPPLRVLATSYYSRGQWLVAGAGGNRPDNPPPLPSVSSRPYELTVSDNTLAAPRVAAPYPVLGVYMPGTRWSIDPVTRDVRVDRAVTEYKITYADIAPSPPQLRQSGTPDSPDITDDDLALPDRSRELIQRWSDEVTRGADNPLDRAIAIQTHLRDPLRYTYTLDLGDQPHDAQGRPLEPVQAFYQTRRGYCVQFATAMIMMARAQGIPARMAIGFLPGLATGDNRYVVRASDAHAWPELYFQGYGWLRFEPTPGVRSGTPPPYTVVGPNGGPTAGGRDVDRATTGAPATSSLRTLENPAAGGAAPQQPSLIGSIGSTFSLRNVLTALAVLVGLLAAFIMPITAWWLRLRRRRAAVTQQELIEAEWQELTSHLGDLGLTSPAGTTLRQLHKRYVTEGHLDEENAAAMSRVTATLEKSRYDRPERTSPQEVDRVHHDIQSIRRQVGRSRAWQARVKGFLWPEAGVSFWRSLPDRVVNRRRR